MSETIENIKYVDIYKKDKNGNILVTKTMTPNDFEKINQMGAKIKEVEQSLDNKIGSASEKTDFEIEQLRSQQTSLKTRVEEVFNNGIDEIQQKRIEALEKVDLQELADIEKAAQDIEELRANGLTDMAALQAKDTEHDQLIAKNAADIAELTSVQNAKNLEQDSAIGELRSKIDSEVSTLADDVEINKNNIEVLGSSIIDLRTSTESNFEGVRTDIAALQDSINSDITTKLNTLSEGQAAKNLEQDLEIQKLQESNDTKLVAVEGETSVPESATEQEIYFVESSDHIVF